MSESFSIAEIEPAKGAVERAAVYRLRYRILVEELGRRADAADHERRLLEDPEDPVSYLIQARHEGGLIAALRLTWGRDGGFSESLEADYELSPFLEIVAPEQIALVERLVIGTEQREGDLPVQLLSACRSFADRQGVSALFIAVEPPQVRRYLDLGFRVYTRRIFNGPETGYLLPLVLVVQDQRHLRAVGSPLAGPPDAPVRERPDLDRLLSQVLESDEAISSRRLFSREEFWTRLKRSAVPARVREIGLFDGLSEAEIRACLRNSQSFECDAGHRIITRGEAATNIYMALSGTLEERDGDEVVAIISAGEVFGEIAFFLGLPRTMDVVAATDGVKVVSFNEVTIRKMILREAETATKLLLNISKMLCARVVKLE